MGGRRCGRPQGTPGLVHTLLLQVGFCIAHSCVLRVLASEFYRASFRGRDEIGGASLLIPQGGNLWESQSRCPWEKRAAPSWCEHRVTEYQNWRNRSPPLSQELDFQIYRRYLWRAWYSSMKSSLLACRRPGAPPRHHSQPHLGPLQTTSWTSALTSVLGCGRRRHPVHTWVRKAIPSISFWWRSRLTSGEPCLVCLATGWSQGGVRENDITIKSNGISKLWGPK